ncbi:MAG TPA: RNA polymerase sigma factor SigJ [Acidimicrobiales bacterium]|nr:RNA polymerase sigma factor SigJ [Acidimicrobiales bacterium]
MTGRIDAEAFDAERPRLSGLAYRMLGTWADAEDVVQDVWLRAQAAEGIDRPEAWLTTVTTRVCLDRIRATKRRREEYVGPWLPEPMVSGAGPEEAAELSDSLTLGFLTILDRLQPLERAVFLLADVFAVRFSDIAAAVGKSDVACRQIASRARRRIAGASARQPTGAERQIVDDLFVALATGDVELALRRLAPDVVCVSDGGSKRHAARRPVVGSDRVARLLGNLSRRLPPTTSVVPATVNGDPGFVVTIDGATDSVIACEVEGERVAAIWIIRNPDKLEHVGDHLALV